MIWWGERNVLAPVPGDEPGTFVGPEEKPANVRTPETQGPANSLQRRCGIDTRI